MNKKTPPKENILMKEVKESAISRIKQYKEQELEVIEFLKLNPTHPDEQRELDVEEIKLEIKFLRNEYHEILPYIKKVKSFTNNIFDRNSYTASYFLFGKISQTLNAIFILLENGYHYESMELIRSNREACDLIALFLSLKEDQKYLLVNWFDGEIVEHSHSRKAIDSMVNESLVDKIPMEQGMSGIYRGLSKYTHVSYIAILDSYDVYNRDFDFNKNSNYHYVKSSSIPYLKGEIDAILIQLKNFYHVVNDYKSYIELDNILKKYSSRFKKQLTMDEAKAEIMKRYKI